MVRLFLYLHLFIKLIDSMKIQNSIYLISACLLLQSQVSIQDNPEPKELHEIKGNEAKAIEAYFHTGSGSIDGSLCVGGDCLSAESFGFDTQRFKENNLRVHFDDTSTSASFPANDWRILINDSSNGGGKYFAVEDVTASRIPFKIEAGARANALYVDSQGDVGIGTSTPATDIEIKIGDTPTVRLQQDGTSGFTAQTWDMAGNEAGFFIRDVTGGSTLPFRIRPGAPTSAVDIKSGSVEIKSASVLDIHSPFDMELNHKVFALNDATEVIKALKPISYSYKNEYISELGLPTGNQYGFSADEVEKLFPSLLMKQTIGDSKKEFQFLNYQSLIPVMVKAIQEQQSIIENQQSEIKLLKENASQYARLESRLLELERNQKGSIQTFARK